MYRRHTFEPRTRVYSDVMEEIDTQVEKNSRSICRLNSESEDMKNRIDEISGIQRPIQNITFNTVSDLKNSTNVSDGMIVRTNGYNYVNDGGSAYYRITSIRPSGFFESISNDLYAELFVNNALRLKQLGADRSSASHDTAILDRAIEVATYYKNLEIVLDDNYTFERINITSNNTKIVGIKNYGITIRVNGYDGIGINVSSNFNTIADVYFTTGNQITLLNVTGKYNTFDNVVMYGNETISTTGVEVKSWANKFDNCVFRTFRKCAIVDTQGGYVTFHQCIFIGSSTSLNDCVPITINNGTCVVFDTCDIEKGYNIIKINGGYTTFSNSYIEAGSNDYHIVCNAGDVVFDKNYMAARISKSASCAVTIVNNEIMTFADKYNITMVDQNTGYFVLANNVVKGSGYIIRLTSKNPNAKIYYLSDGQWVAGCEMNDYVYISQSNCYSVDDSPRIQIGRARNDGNVVSSLTIGSTKLTEANLKSLLALL